MGLQEVQHLTQRVREIVEAHPGGRNDPDAHLALSYLLPQLRLALGKGPASKAFRLLKQSLEAYYSQRKYRRVPGQLSAVRLNIQSSLDQIESAAHGPDYLPPKNRFDET